MGATFATLGDLRKGSYIIIDGEPCKIVEYSKAKPGKHGSAKASIVAIGIFSKQKKSLVAPVDTQVQVPLIEKRLGQVLADVGDKIQVLDMESYETLEVDKPEDDPELSAKLVPGAAIEYWVIMGMPKIIRVRSQ